MRDMHKNSGKTFSTNTPIEIACYTDTRLWYAVTGAHTNTHTIYTLTNTPVCSLVRACAVCACVRTASTHTHDQHKIAYSHPAIKYKMRNYKAREYNTEKQLGHFKFSHTACE